MLALCMLAVSVSAGVQEEAPQPNSLLAYVGLVSLDTFQALQTHTETLKAEHLRETDFLQRIIDELKDQLDLALRAKIKAELELDMVMPQMELLKKKESSCREDLYKVRKAADRRLQENKKDLDVCLRQRDHARLKQRRLRTKQIQDVHRLSGCFQDLKVASKSKTEAVQTVLDIRRSFGNLTEALEKCNGDQKTLETQLSSYQAAHTKLSSALSSNQATLTVVSCLVFISVVFNMFLLFFSSRLKRELMFFVDSTPKILEQNDRLCDLLERCHTGKFDS